MTSSAIPIFWQAPLVPAATAWTIGVVLDRIYGVSFHLSLLVSGVSLTVWIWVYFKKENYPAVVWLGLALLFLGAAYHHWRQLPPGPSDIRDFAGTEPILCRIRGFLCDEPQFKRKTEHPLRTFSPKDFSQVKLEVTHFYEDNRWVDASGSVLLSVPDSLFDFHAGDEVVVLGQLQRLLPPSNPGELDQSFLQDRGIRATLRLQNTAEAIQLRKRGFSWSLPSYLEGVRIWSRRLIEKILPPEQQKMALALLLGQQSAMETEEWDRYQRTGIVHLFAISGQHLVILVWFLRICFQSTYISRRKSSFIILGFLFAYALLTGARPPVMRATLMIYTFVIGYSLRKVILPANSLAFAWLLVCLWNPATIFNAGCQLSFLAVVILYWSRSYLSLREKESTEKLLDQQRPLWIKMFLWSIRKIGVVYGVTFLVWFSLTPLIAYRFHVISPSGAIIGPPVALLISIALLAGFIMLVSGVIFLPLAYVFAWIVTRCLQFCQTLVRLAEQFPGAYFYIPDIPEWWIIGFYLLLLGWIAFPVQWVRWYWMIPAIILWLCIGLSTSLTRSTPEGLRCTFLSVGHGSCVVLETSDGRTLLYDAGAITGPGVTRKKIAPFLWHQGIRQIDEIFLSHADLDHFNGLTAILERFPVGQITCNPSFAERDLEGVRLTLKTIQVREVPLRSVSFGDHLQSGSVQMEVLHPPELGPPGVENARSMVLLIKHQNHRILLTGDLEKEGLNRFKVHKPIPVDILMAPHHGSPSANQEFWANWAKPKVVVSCQGKRKGNRQWQNPYLDIGATYLTTQKEGAVTITSSKQGLKIKTFKTGKQWEFPD